MGHHFVQNVKCLGSPFHILDKFELLALSFEIDGQTHRGQRLSAPVGLTETNKPTSKLFNLQHGIIYTTLESVLITAAPPNR